MNELMLKKTNQDEFLKLRGLTVLEKWLIQNPDGSYPPYQVVDSVMDILDRLPIMIEHLQDCNVAKVLQLYAAGRSKMGKTITS